MMSFEKLDVYQVAIEFLGTATRINQASPKGNADLQDQLKRAAISIPLNIAEAAGKTSPADIRRFFAIARGSAMECGAILDVFVKLGNINGAEAMDGKALLERIVAMLTKLARPQR